jgi:nucleoid DNA-binding protein
MRTHPGFALGFLLAAAGLVLGLTASAQTQRPREETLTQRLARGAKLSEESADRLFKALGPVIREDLRKGKEVNIPGLGTFRVVRVAEHKDLRDGRPVVVPATNVVEFVGDEAIDVAANSEGAKPAETVPAFQYLVLPGQTPGQKVGRTRTLPTRTR